MEAPEKTGTRLLRIDQVCARLNCSRSAGYRLVNEGKLRACQIGSRSLRVPEDALEEYIQEQIALFQYEEGGR